MRIEVPILIRPETDGCGRTTVQTVRPLFFEGPTFSDRHLGEAVSRMTNKLQEQLEKLASSGDHASVAAYGFSPDLRLEWLELRLELRRSMFLGWFPLVVFNHKGRRLAVSPYLLELWFDIPRGENIAERATDVFTRYFRNLERQQEDWQLKRCLDSFRSKKKPSVSLLWVYLDTCIRLPDPGALPFALLGGTGKMDGARELSRVGRCLQKRYPDELERALRRTRLVTELDGLLAMPDKRPILLVGPPAVGRTALVQDIVYRDTHRRRQDSPRGDHLPNHWLLAPQRLVTGMSFVGQWEDRLLAILRHVRNQRHVLVFDDLLGLYQAGVSAQSNLSAADVLKPFVERGEVRLLAEMTAEQLRRFRERDRGFVDLFHILPVEEPDEEDNLRILLGVIRRLEARHGTRFALPVLPTVLDLTRRYQRDAAFPGKAVDWLRQLAAKHPNREVTRRDALEEFRIKSGLDLAFLDSEQRLARDDVLTALRSRIIGQDEAVEAMADVVCLAKARLNDPERPLGSLLFLGPTGVGKTECAKALAAYLFGDESRLLRFDMNEFISPHAAARLAGTFDQPEGLLTSAVRREPFCVLLFDEIEKAHPDVFDLLLQVLGEARLTDALGRTTDFSNAVVILTSNLGTREAAAEVGFVPGGQATGSVYVKAVESFFRPEFFNRLDRIIPFQRLSREELGRIARSIIAGILSRAGLAQRKCTVDLTGDAIEWTVDRGYHPALGARAMRRAVESELVRPVARKLAAIRPETPTVVRVFRRKEQLVADVAALIEAEPLPESARPAAFDDPKGLLAQCHVACDRLEQACKVWRPEGELSAANPSPLFAWYLGLIDNIGRLRGAFRRIGHDLDGARERSIEPMLTPRQPRSWEKTLRRVITLRREIWEAPMRRLLEELYAAQDVFEYIDGLRAALDASAPCATSADVTRRLASELDRLALWNALCPDEQGWQWERVLALVRGVDKEAALQVADLGHRLAATVVFDTDTPQYPGFEFGLEGKRWTPHGVAQDNNGPLNDQRPGWLQWVADPDLRAAYGARHHLDAMLFEGHRAVRLLQVMEGTHLFVTQDGRLVPLQVVVLPLVQDESPEQRLLDCLAEHDRAQEAMACGETSAKPDPFAWRPVVTFYPGATMAPICFRSGSGSSRPGALFPLPPELIGEGEAGASPAPPGSTPP